MKSIASKIIAMLAVVLIVGAAYTMVSGVTLAPRTASAALGLFNEDTVTSIYDNASPAVVEIKVVERGTSIFGRSLQEGQGSGFLVDKEGYILTNNHVVSGASNVQVLLKGGKTVDATITGASRFEDLALIKVDSLAVSGITPLKFGDSSLVKPGQMAIALGSPYGLDNSITVGVISGLNRSLSGSNLTGLLQTDAAINPGNSGGPLLNSSGQVIGINTAIQSGTVARGIGFAVTSNVANKRLPELMAGKQVTRPWLGISGTALTGTLANTLNLSVNQGVYIVTVIPNGPAEKAGLKGGSIDANGQAVSGGDVITAVDGRAATSVEDISAYLSANKKVGDIVRLTVLRGGKDVTVTVTLGEFPDNVSTNIVPAPTPQSSPQPIVPRSRGRNFGGQASPHD
ncbi:MAG: PDZ protein [Dehalococcoidia bacterium]|nr:PDZ protein [Dehalococcoidia bacterium]